jgi:radical SAM-linked protein
LTPHFDIDVTNAANYTVRPMDTQQRWRITFAKCSPIKYISHLDLCRAWERILRRAGLPIAYTQGFNPQARLQLAAALPVGHTGSAEMMDVILERPIDAGEFVTRVPPALPDGLILVDAREIDPKVASLQSALREAEYRVRLSTLVARHEVARRVAGFLSADHLEQRRVRKQHVETVDVRPLVDDVRLEAGNVGEVVLWMRVSSGPGGHLRPDTVLEALELAGGHPQIERTRLLFEDSRPPESPEG